MVLNSLRASGRPSNNHSLGHVYRFNVRPALRHTEEERGGLVVGSCILILQLSSSSLL